MMKRFQKNEIPKKINIAVATYGVPGCKFSRIIQKVSLVTVVELSDSVLRQLNSESFVIIIPEPELKFPDSVIFRSMARLFCIRERRKKNM